MHKHCLLAAAGLLLVSAGWASAQQKVGELRSLGSATVYVMPDTAEVSFTVMGEDKTLAVARQRAAETMDNVMAAVNKLKIEGLTMNTESIRVNPVYEAEQGAKPGPYYDEGETARKTVGYRVRNSLSVKIRADVDKLKRGTAQVIDAALVAGAGTLYGPSFSKEDTAAAQQEAIAKATKNAIDNLQALARGMGVAAIRVVSASLYAPEEARYSEMRLGTLSDLSDGGPGPTATQVEVEAIPLEVTVWANAEYALAGG